MKKLLLSIAIAFSLLLSTFGVQVHADIPQRTGDIYVQDHANLLSVQQKQQLNQIGRQLDDETKAQIAVLTVDSLDGLSLEEYAVKAFRQYGLGDEKLNNGVLLLVAMEERQVRIEVGYGLEGALPDGKTGRILDEYTVPLLKENQPDQAIMNTYQLLYNEVATEYNVPTLENSEIIDQYNNYDSDYATTGDTEIPGWLMFVIVIGVIILITIDMKFFGGTITMLLFHLAASIARNGGRGGGGGGGSRGGGGGSSGGGGAGRGW